MFNIAKKKLGAETFWDSVKFTWDSTFVDALGPRDPIEIKPKSNTVLNFINVNCESSGNTAWMGRLVAPSLSSKIVCTGPNIFCFYLPY